MSAAVELRERLRRYYTAYYRDTLGIRGWAALVALREHEEQEVEHLERVRRLVGAQALRGRLLSMGCGTGGFNAVATAAGAYMVGVDEEPRRLRSAGCASGGPLAGC